jgi:hypothetical protein
MNVIFWSSTSADWNIPSRYIGPYKIAHWISKYGYSSQVIDFVNYFHKGGLYEITKKFISDETMVIAISTTFLVGNYSWSDGTNRAFPEELIIAARKIKIENPKIKFILGGYGSEHIFGSEVFDAVVMTYKEASEDIFVELLDHYKKGTAPPKNRLLINFYNTGSSKIKPRPHFYEANSKVYNIEVDDFKFTKQHAILPNEALPLDISRGCIFACRFCNYPHLGKSKTDYIRGMEYVKEELIYNYEQFGTTNYMVLDDTFNETQVKLEAFLEMTKTLPFKITYTAYIRADLIERFPDTAHILKDSGLWGAFHGLESLHPYASNIVGKAWSGKHARDFIPKLYHDIWKSEVPQLLSFIMGLPKETYEDVKSTLDWVKQNDLYSISIERLALQNPKLSYRKSITSEFERNPDKYGFSFVENAADSHPYFTWKNETWDSTDQKNFHDKYFQLYKFIDKHKLRKITIWNLGNMQMLGYDKDYLLKTAKADFDMELLELRKRNAYEQYFNLLKSL